MEQKGNRLTGIIRDKSVADRVIRALVHAGFPPDNVSVMVSGVTTTDFNLHEPGVKVVRYPEMTTTGATAETRPSTDKSLLADWGVPQTEMTQWEGRLMEGDVLINVMCGGDRCNMARSIFQDAGAREKDIMGSQGMGATPMPAIPGQMTQGPMDKPSEMRPTSESMQSVPMPTRPERDLNENPEKMPPEALRQFEGEERMQAEQTAGVQPPTGEQSQMGQTPQAGQTGMSATGRTGEQMQQGSEQMSGESGQDTGETDEEFFIFIVTETDETYEQP
jgi:hypothetical protein